MGMFTTISHAGGSCQIKTGWDNCDTYKTGDEIPWKPDPLYPGDHIDGVHLGYGERENDTLVVIKDCTVVAVIFKKYGQPTDKQIAALKKAYGIKPPNRSLWSKKAWAEKEARDKKAKKKQEKRDREHAHLTPEEKMAAVMSEFITQKMSEPSFARQILPPIPKKTEKRWWVVGVEDGHILFERKDIKDTEALLGAALLHLARHGYRGLNFSLDPNNPVPVDIQLKDHVKDAIIKALLKGG